MALFEAFFRLRNELPAFKVIHINHGLRPESQEEQQFLEQEAFKRKTPLICRRMPVHFLPEEKNFEKRARLFRYQIFQELCGADGLVYTAHHLDDSFEWSLMQTLKSSTGNNLGIPLRRGIVRRPFLCFTRKQIERFLQMTQTAYRDDASNFNMSRERAFLRHQIIPQLKQRYPQLLKHYVTRNNLRAQELGVWGLYPQAQKTFWSFSGKNCALLVHPQGGQDFFHASHRIWTLLKSLSSIERGRQGEQVKKLIEAATKGKQGPLNFSGGVQVAIMPGLMFFYREKKQGLGQALTAKWTRREFERELQRKICTTPELFPFWITSQDSNARSVVKGLKKRHFLWEKQTATWVKQQLWFQNAWNFLRHWKNSSLSHQEVELTLHF